MGPGILIIVYKGIGDVLLTTPLLRALKTAIPDSRLYFLTRRPSLKVLRGNPRLDGVFCREDSPLGAIRAAGIDITFDYMRSTSSGFYALFSGAGKRLAFKFGAGRLWHNILPEKKPGAGYTVYDRLQLLEPLGIPPAGHELELNFAPENAARADAFLAASGVRPGDFTVTLDITSPRDHRRWAPENFARLADGLTRDFGARVVFLWGPGELEYVKAAMASASMPHLLCPDFDLLDLAALQKRAALHCGTSSGPMHLAVSQGAPTFTIYAPQNSPQSWSPPGPRHAWVQGELAALPFETAWDRLRAHVETLKKVQS
ncbi:MAG: glycosyltransferase family 9 protein [Elusimicrobiales bacterium]|nr:glycosyltransferase family 9 protein [Elusimicrobiales bacterium]